MRAGSLGFGSLYTSAVWTWGELPCAQLFASAESKRVFDVTNAALGLARVFQSGHASLRHSLLHRHQMIDHLLRASGARRVIEIAAGLSRRGATATEDPGVHYVEIDLPDVINAKRELLLRTSEGKAVLARPGFRMIASPVERTDLTAYVAAGQPVFVIIEGLMMYLSAGARRELAAKIRGLVELTGDVRFVFDLVPQAEQPPPGTAGRVLEAAMKRFTGGRTFERDAHTRADILAELVGWDETAAISSTDVASAWNLMYPHEQTQTVLFTARATSRATPS